MMPLLSILVQRATRTRIGDHQNATLRKIAHDFEDGSPRHILALFNQVLVHLVGRAVPPDIG